jgi:FtsP/CotA-like multicopper oxidase with cupredoxin domain
MAQSKEYWLQLENQPWDVCPWGVDRVASVLLPKGPGGAHRPTAQEALILRRYTPNWAQPAGEAINPWDLTEPSPAQTGGGFPGARLEAKVADQIVVHFRNMDQRSGIPDAERIHSLHAHGVQRAPLYDGAFPLSPPDPGQNGRRGDRVAPGESFTYRWTCPQRAAAGAWLIHDASLAGARSTALGALAVVIIRAPGEQRPDLPASALRQPGDSATRFAAVPQPPKRGEYVLLFHELPGVGLCLNGRQALGNTPAMIAGMGTRMAFHCLNATADTITVHIHGHRWQRGNRWLDAELLPAGGGAMLSMLSGSSENGGGLGEWLVTGSSGAAQVAGSLVVTAAGAVTLA